MKGVKTLLLAGRHKMSCTHEEHMGTPGKQLPDFNTSQEMFRHSAVRPEASILQGGGSSLDFGITEKLSGQSFQNRKRGD